VPAIAGQAFRIDPAEVADFRPSYRNLSWCLVKTGYEVDHDLPGEDRPATVAKLLQDVYGWASLPLPS
jgi:hypothetical protein